MFMRKIKFKILILLMCFISINQYSLNVFADTPSDDIPSVNKIQILQLIKIIALQC